MERVKWKEDGDESRSFGCPSFGDSCSPAVASKPAYIIISPIQWRIQGRGATLVKKKSITKVGNQNSTLFVVLLKGGGGC